MLASIPLSKYSSINQNAGKESGHDDVSRNWRWNRRRNRISTLKKNRAKDEGCRLGWQSAAVLFLT